MSAFPSVRKTLQLSVYGLISAHSGRRNRLHHRLTVQTLTDSPGRCDLINTQSHLHTHTHTHTHTHQMPGRLNCETLRTLVTNPHTREVTMEGTDVRACVCACVGPHEALISTQTIISPAIMAASSSASQLPN